MSFYVSCPTCWRTLSENKEEFIQAKYDIDHNPQYSKQEKADRFAALVTSTYRAPCCKLRIMGELPYHEIMVSDTRPS